MLSDYIKKLRKKYGLTQAEVAIAIKVSRPTYINIERGKRDVTTTEATRLAKIFNMPLKNFLNEKNIDVKIPTKCREYYQHPLPNSVDFISFPQNITKQEWQLAKAQIDSLINYLEKNKK